MIKFVFCAKRCTNMSRAEFQDYWLNHHGLLFKKFADTYRAVRYVQSHTIDSPLNENIMKSRGTSEAYDGVGEIWWQSEEDFLAAINSPEGQKLRAMFVEDEARFVNLNASSAFFTVEHVLIDGKVY
ncbi:MAG: EthD domain-containing protein [Proteobacteria bacterium]|nr:EthD domain-containing protein [Pseudomonadota bacterium]